MAGDTIACEGIVLAWARGVGKVEVTIGQRKRIVTARRNGVMDRKRILVVPGDRVRLELSPYDLSRGRITWRFRDELGSG